jgi:Tfp pilus assembly major pilin PilA
VVLDSEGSGDSLGFLINIISLIVIVLLIAIMSLMYVDILTTKHEVREQVQAMDRLRKEVEKSKTETEKKE